MSARRFVPRLAIALGVIMVLSTASALASFSHPFVSSFGSFTNVQGVAIDQSTGDVYVLDTGAGEGSLLKFDSAGNPLKFTGLAGEPAVITGLKGGGSAENELAVDNSNGPAKGDIYVAVSTSNGADIDVIASNGEPLGTLSEAIAPWGETCGVAVDPSGNVYVGVYGGDIDKFVPAANPVTNADYVSSISGVSSPCNLAVDSLGNVFAATYPSGPVTRYEASQFGSLSVMGSIVDTVGSTVAVGPVDDHLYVDEGGQVAEYDAHGEPFKGPISTFADTGKGAVAGSLGIAVNGTSGDIYLSDGDGHLSIFGSAVSIPTVVTGGPSNITTGAVTLNGTVDPEDITVTGCKFEYGVTTAYGQTVPCATVPGEGNVPASVVAAISGLQSGTEYHFRLVASNANGESFGSDQILKTAAPPTIEGESVSDVSGSGATVEAAIDPLGSDTTYHFEYGTSESYGDTVPIPDVDIGSSEVGQSVVAHIQKLEAATIYHFRVVATSAFGVRNGTDQRFITQAAGGKLNLLDGRQWEVVTPQQKHGAGIEMVPATFGGGAIQAAEDGNAFTYLANSPIEEAPSGNRAPEPVQIFAKRVGGSWSNRTIATPHNENKGGLVLGGGSEYVLFSPDLSLGLVKPRGATPLAAGVTDHTQYVRDNAACEVSPATCYTPLVTPANTQPGAKWETAEPLSEPDGKTKISGATEDLSHVVIQSSTQLTATAAGEGLYEWSGGRLQFVSVLPESEGGAPENGSQNSGVRNAISSDGSRVVWSAPSSGNLYMTDVDKMEAVRLDVAQPGAVGGAGVPVFDAATADDSRIFFTDKAQLVVGAGNATADEEEGDLYECQMTESAGKLACLLTDITKAGIDGQVLGISQDGSYVYFVSNAILADGAGAGDCYRFGADNQTCNLYVAHRSGSGWSTAFIAMLSGEDEKDWGEGRANYPAFAKITARVSQNGRYVTFMSDASLTGYDNRDISSGALDEEVFLYDVVANKLRCVSCDPSGARPVGVFAPEGLAEDPPLVDTQEAWEERWLAGNVPPWVRTQRAFYQPRYLLDNGRMFFDSSDALVPQDTNGLEDVYEYEPEGIGNCARAGGCVGLITSGTSKEESAFMDASASGDDVFVLTSSQLVAQDHDTALDVYDAHVCTTSVPCSESAVPPPPCDTSDSCKAAPTPQPSFFGTPPSETFSGSGNAVQEAVVRPSGKSAGLTRAQKLARALKVCGKQHGAKSRAKCRARARKKFAAKTSSRFVKRRENATTKRVSGKTTRAGRGR